MHSTTKIFILLTVFSFLVRSSDRETLTMLFLEQVCSNRDGEMSLKKEDDSGSVWHQFAMDVVDSERHEGGFVESCVPPALFDYLREAPGKHIVIAEPRAEAAGKSGMPFHLIYIENRDVYHHWFSSKADVRRGASQPLKKRMFHAAVKLELAKLNIEGVGGAPSERGKSIKKPGSGSSSSATGGGGGGKGAVGRSRRSAEVKSLRRLFSTDSESEDDDYDLDQLGGGGGSGPSADSIGVGAAAAGGQPEEWFLWEDVSQRVKDRFAAGDKRVVYLGEEYKQNPEGRIMMKIRYELIGD